jgi:hypothetical protein
VKPTSKPSASKKRKKDEMCKNNMCDEVDEPDSQKEPKRRKLNTSCDSEVTTSGKKGLNSSFMINKKNPPVVP